jgi:DNA-binding transcriptional MerR regulator
MNDPSNPKKIWLSISAVERDTGLSKDTLRVWERRYGFPQPARDEFGERIYSLDQVDKLRVIKRLMDQGYRPGKIIHNTIEQLQKLAESAAPSPVRSGDALDPHEDLQCHMELVKQHRVDELRRQLSQAVLRLGLSRFVTDVVAPLNEMVGDAWTRGYFEIFEEHLYTESMQVILRNAINTIPHPGTLGGPRPRILLTTFPQEQHGLGLLMAEALCALDGAYCWRPPPSALTSSPCRSRPASIRTRCWTGLPSCARNCRELPRSGLAEPVLFFIAVRPATCAPCAGLMPFLQRSASGGPPEGSNDLDVCRQQAFAAEQDLCCLRQTHELAQGLGKELGAGALLLRPLPQKQGRIRGFLRWLRRGCG